MKKFVSFVVLFLLSFSINAYDGVMSGTRGKLNEVNTEYFDIIFPDECRPSALKIASKADDYYREIAGKLGYSPYQRFPVTLTKQVENPNAYFSMGPYNHIVVYDAQITDDVDMYEDAVLSFFYHELTHAVTLNSKSEFWQGMSFFADFLTPSGLSLTSFWYEGATVSMESGADGGYGGRLNDPFFTQLVVEAKVQELCGEKSFPSWRDVTGARDTYPYGNDAYAFGACFAFYLQKTYGEKKYAQFWKNAGTSISLSFCAGVFEETYGKNLSDVWEDFIKSIEIPAGVLEKRKAQIESKYISNKKSVVNTCDYWKSADGKKSHFAYFDSLSSSLFVDGKKVLGCNSIKQIRFTEDGKALLIKRFVERSNTKLESFVYQLENNSVNSESYSDCYIQKNGLNWTICYESNGTKHFYDMDSRILHNLHKEKEDEDFCHYVFVWAELTENGFTESSKSFSRGGKIIINKKNYNAQILLQKNDNFAPLLELIPSQTDAQYMAVTEKLYARPLELIDIDWENCNIIIVQSSAEPSIRQVEEMQENPVTFEEKVFNINKSSQLKYFKNGAKLPLAVIPEYNFDYQTVSAGFLGVTFASTNSWTSSLTMLSLGWDPYNNKWGSYGSYSTGDGNVSFAVNGSVLFDETDFYQLYSKANLSLALYKGKIDSLKTGITAEILRGSDIKEYEFKAIFTNRDNEEKIIKCSREGMAERGQLYLSYSTMHKVRPEYSGVAGLLIQPLVYCDCLDSSYYYKKTKVAEKDSSVINGGVIVMARNCSVLPVTVYSSLFGNTDSLLRSYIKVQLIEKDIHRGIKGISVFAQRFTLNVQYDSLLKYKNEGNWDLFRAASIFKEVEKEDYEDYISLSGEFTLAPNTSYFASSTYNFGLGARLMYSINNGDNKRFKCGVYTNIAW